MERYLAVFMHKRLFQSAKVDFLTELIRLANVICTPAPDLQPADNKNHENDDGNSEDADGDADDATADGDDEDDDDDDDDDNDDNAGLKRFPSTQKNQKSRPLQNISIQNKNKTKSPVKNPTQNALGGSLLDCQIMIFSCRQVFITFSNFFSFYSVACLLNDCDMFIFMLKLTGNFNNTV